MPEIDSNELVETLNDAQTYLSALLALQKELKTAELQIIKSADTSIKDIENLFNKLIKKITKTLESRKDNLINDTRKIHDQSLEPLRSSQNVISDKLLETYKLIEMTKNVNAINIEEFNNKTSRLGSLPEVPELKEVSFITFQFDKNVEKDLLESCSGIGTVCRIAPVQINSLSGKPGAILVEWEPVDSDEPYAEIQEYHLQKAMGNALHNSTGIFYDCYKGSELQYLVQDLKPHQEYSFRICCKFEGCSDYSPWSVIQVGRTHIAPYSWSSNPNFMLTNESKIATALNNAPSVILSDGHQFCFGNTLEFTFLGVGEKLKDNYIGVVLNKEVKLEGPKEGTFLLEATGEIYVDGVLKSTKLPPIFSGCKVSFMCTCVNEEKIRMNIDVCNKRVTYDWSVENRTAMHFLGKFNSANWKVLVE